MGTLTCLDSISLTFSCALIRGVKTLEEKHYSKEVHSSPLTPSRIRLSVWLSRFLYYLL